MKISEEALQKIIKDEINEIFGFGKKKKKKQVKQEYPASELSTIIKALDDASRMSGAKLTPEQREAILDELTSILRARDFVVKENERLFLGDDYSDFLISSGTTPKLNAFLKTIARKNPKVFGQLQKVLKRGAFEISPREKYGTTGSDDQAQTNQSDKEDIDMSDIPGSDSALAASADAISSAAKKSPKSTPAPSTDQKSSKSSEAEDFIAQQFGKKVPLDAIKSFKDTQGIDDDTARKIVKVVRNAGYRLTEAQIKRFKEIAGIK